MKADRWDAFVCREERAPLESGPLDGWTFGVKDIIETADFPTRYGSAIFAGAAPTRDAPVVETFRRLGATLLGKTHTTVFAYFDAAPTRNPRAPGHTPGGSSSGSAAAVAAGMVDFAIGTQTMGSVLRPASFCGVCGFKPSHGYFPVEGVMPFAPTLDTVGLFTLSAASMAQLWRKAGFGMEVDELPIVALPLPSDTEPLMADAFLARELRVVEPPASFYDVGPAAITINDYEGARSCREHFERHGDGIGLKLATLVRRGLATPEADYRAAVDRLAECRADMDRFLAAHPVIAWPAAPGPAPATLRSTGDPRMNRPFTALGLPAVSVPMPVDGLPLGIQLVAARGGEAQLLATASAVEYRMMQNKRP